MIHYPMFALVGPSGSGKTTIARKLIEEYPHRFDFSVSHTSRKRGDHEVHGKDYFFIGHKRFSRMSVLGKFFEWESVYGDDMYGTSIDELKRIYQGGKNPLLDIDVKGARRIMNHGPRIFEEHPEFKGRLHFTPIFIDVPDRAEIERRIRERKRGESEEKIQQRLNRYDMEQREKKHFSHVVLNHNLDECYEHVKRIIGDILELSPVGS